jgi:putative transposase
MAAEGLPVQLACRLLVVAESGYYEWRSRQPSQRAIRHVWLTEQIRAVHAASRGTYGARRVHAELTLGLGLQVGHNQVEVLMARAAIKGLPGTRRPRPRHETPTAADLVERMFTRTQPNRLWVTDITEHRTSWILSVVATRVIYACSSKAVNRSAGVSQPRVFRGRVLSCSATAWRSVTL